MNGHICPISSILWPRGCAYHLAERQILSWKREPSLKGLPAGPVWFQVLPWKSVHSPPSPVFVERGFLARRWGGSLPRLPRQRWQDHPLSSFRREVFDPPRVPLLHAWPARDQESRANCLALGLGAPTEEGAQAPKAERERERVRPSSYLQTPTLKRGKQQNRDPRATEGEEAEPPNRTESRRFRCFELPAANRKNNARGPGPPPRRAPAAALPPPRGRDTLAKSLRRAVGPPHAGGGGGDRGLRDAAGESPPARARARARHARCQRICLILNMFKEMLGGAGAVSAAG